MTRKSIWLKLIIWDVILIVCIAVNGYQYMKNPNTMTLWTMIFVGLVLIIITCIYVHLLRKFS